MRRPSFSRNLLRWGTHSGRTSLPWQTAKTPYKVWVSEIMLQQTQVKTVIPYFRRFMKRFPNLTQLANAPRSEVLKYWAGLGYYNRAHNLHNSAKEIVTKHGRRFPQEHSTLMQLPGIGRSTASAILALCHNEPHAILDGNVMRVLTRHFDIAGWPRNTRVTAELWELSENLLPQNNVADYTQSLMDLGATVCTPSRPHCELCPVSRTCKARLHGTIEQRPQKKPAVTKPRQVTYMLIALHKDKVLLQKRPNKGIWSGLLCFPEFRNLSEAKSWSTRYFPMCSKPKALPELEHHLTHLLLSIKPIKISLPEMTQKVPTLPATTWCKINRQLAVPAPVSKLLSQL